MIDQIRLHWRTQFHLFAFNWTFKQYYTVKSVESSPLIVLTTNETGNHV